MVSPVGGLAGLYGHYCNSTSRGGRVQARIPRPNIRFESADHPLWDVNNGSKQDWTDGV
jgi:hypothetical protein